MRNWQYDGCGETPETNCRNSLQGAKDDPIINANDFIVNSETIFI
jgi:hypothetical protein